MIDTKELRRLAQAALAGPDGISLSWIKLLQDFQQKVSPAAVSELLDRLEAAEKELAELRSSMKFRTSLIGRTEAERDALRAKAAEMEQPESGFRERCTPSSPTGYSNRFPLYALPGAQNVPKAVAYLDLGAGGYMDIGTDLTDEALAALPKGRHMLGIVGTYGADGYVPAQPAPSVPTALLVAAADLVAQMEIVSCVGFVDTPDDKDSCAAFCVAEGTWLELVSAVESLAAWLAAAPEAKP